MPLPSSSFPGVDPPLDSPRPLEPVATSQRKIFVRVAAYRDPDCSNTLLDLFEKAHVPERLRVGVCLQYAPGRESPNVRLGRFASQVEVVRVRAAESRGVCWARARTELLHRGESHTLQVDSHCRFLPGFDDILFEELDACENQRTILSCSPASLSAGVKHGAGLTRRVVSFISPDGNVRLRGVARDNEGRELSPFIAAGFLFSRSEVLNEVPYDPNLYFDQEEISYSLRLHAAGWDVVAPGRQVVFHRYRTGQGEEPTHHQDHPEWRALHEQGTKRWRSLLSRPGALGRYGLAGIRSLGSFEKLARVNLRDGTFEPELGAQLRCGEQAEPSPRSPQVLGVCDKIPAAKLERRGAGLRNTESLAGQWTVLVLPARGELGVPGEAALLSRGARSEGYRLVCVVAGGEAIAPDFQGEIWIDEGGACRQQLGGSDRSKILVVDPGLTIRFAEEPQHLSAGLKAALGSIPKRFERRPSPAARRHAPVLVLPQVLTREDMGQLNDFLDLGETFPGRVGPRGGRLDPRQKVREDLILGAHACRFVDELLGRRVFPEIERAFGLAVAYREPYKLARYHASSSGFFKGHRDNLDAELCYRRFAISIGLSDDYEGGELDFPEYEGGTYRVRAGEAVVFSCGLLHEARPVRRGVRSILLGFVAGPEARDELNRLGKTKQYLLAAEPLRWGMAPIF